MGFNPVQYHRPDLLVETDWLQGHIDDPDIRIIDCAAFEIYQKAHIPNSVGLRVNPFIKDASDTVHVMPPDQFANLMTELGVGPSTTVVSYDMAGGVPATRMWWALNYYGHTNAKVLNGGWDKWFHEGREISRDIPEIVEAQFIPKANPSVLCSLEHAKSRVGDPSTIFLDVRSDAEWEGEESRGNKRAGRIPGSIHLEWNNFINKGPDRTWKSASELKELLETLGVTPEKEVITY